MKIHKKFLSILLVLVLIPFLGIRAEDGQLQGTLGDGICWRLEEDGTMFVSGNGPIADRLPGNQPSFPTAKRLVIGEGITRIGKNAFSGLRLTEGLTLPQSCKEIGSGAFSDFSAPELEIPGSVQIIGAAAFPSRSIVQIRLEEGVEVLERENFPGCERLSLPASLRQMDSRVQNCRLEIEDLRAYCRLEFGTDSKTDGDCNTLYLHGRPVTELVIPPQTGEISDRAFRGICLNSVELPPLERIGVWAFSGCQLEQVRFAGPIGEIGAYAFSHNALGELMLPEGVERLGEGAFADCEMLHAVTIGEGPVEIPERGFWDCRSLTRLELPVSLEKIGKRAFDGCDLQDLILPAGVQTIGPEAFFQNRRLRSVTFLGNAPNFAPQCFYGCGAAHAFYPGDDPTWTRDRMQSYGTEFSWFPIHAHCFGPWITQEEPSQWQEGVAVRSCTICGFQERKAIEWSCPHSYGPWEQRIPAQVGREGLEARICTQCGQEETRAIPALEDAPHIHVFGPWTVTKEPTACEPGCKSRSCACGVTETAQIPVLYNPFSDVSTTQYYATPVLWAVDRGVTKGTSETTFGPEETCTRAQIVTFLWRNAGKPTPKKQTNPFLDVAPSDYFYQAVLWASEQRITQGISRHSFGPEEGCTRGQVVTFLWRAGAMPQAPEGPNPFTDVREGQFWYDAVLWAVDSGITMGISETAFGPEETCTRGQIVTFLHRAAQLTEEESD